MFRPMHDMLHGIHRNRRCAPGDIQDAFNAQHRLAVPVDEVKRFLREAVGA